MGMMKPKVATCTGCKKTNVLCCTFCGYCADCDTHSFCMAGNGGMKDPLVATCPKCKKTSVLCCTSCGLCGADATHNFCNTDRKVKPRKKTIPKQPLRDGAKPKKTGKARKAKE